MWEGDAATGEGEPVTVGLRGRKKTGAGSSPCFAIDDGRSGGVRYFAFFLFMSSTISAVRSFGLTVSSTKSTDFSSTSSV